MIGNIAMFPPFSFVFTSFSFYFFQLNCNSSTKKYLVWMVARIVFGIGRHLSLSVANM